MTNEKKEDKRITNEEQRKFAFEATVTPEVLDRGRHWIAVKLRNASTEPLVDVSATLYTYLTRTISTFCQAALFTS
jgi:hypothetical protein